VGLGPRQAEHIGQEAFRQAVAADDLLGERASGRGERDPVADLEQAVGLEPADHLRHGRPGHLEPLGDPGLDHVDVVLVELPDRLAVLLGRRVELAPASRVARWVGGHGDSLRSRP